MSIISHHNCIENANDTNYGSNHMDVDASDWKTKKDKMH